MSDITILFTPGEVYTLPLRKTPTVVEDAKRKAIPEWTTMQHQAALRISA
jgi:hypothetical protein